MAQYDGTIRISTQITTDRARESLSSLEYVIKGSAKEIEKLRQKMDALRDQRIPTSEYKDLQEELSEAERNLSELIAKQEEWENVGVTSGGAWDALNEEIATASDNVDALKSRMQELVDSGRDFILGQDTEEYKSAERQIQYEEEAIERARDQYRAIQKAQNAYERLKNVVTSAMKKIGSAIKGSALYSLKSLGNVAKKSVLSSFKLLGRAAKSVFSRIGQSAKKSAGNISSFGSRVKNLAASAFIFNQLSAAFSAMTSGMKEGFENLYGESDDFKRSVDGLKASLLTLKNSLAAAFRPLVEIAIPYIQKAIDYISLLANKIGQLLASLAGQKTYTRAIKQTADAFEDEAKTTEDTADATKKAEKAAEGYLSPLDEINKIGKEKNDEEDISKDKGISESEQKAPMFEEVQISDKFKNIAQRLKDMWENSDFTELGAFLGQKLKTALDNIPWDGIRETASKIGKSIATLINGFVSVEGLGQSIGNTLAQAINTGFEFLNSFVHNLDWGAVGKFVADTISGFFNGIDWNLIYDTFVTGAEGLGTAINSFADNLDWGAISTAVSNIVNTFVDTVYTFFDTVDWGSLGEKVGTFVSDSLAGINWENLGVMIGTGFQSVFTFLLTAIENVDWGNVGTYIADALNGVVESLDLSTVGELLGTSFTGLFDMAISFSKEFDWKKLGDNISSGINGFFEKFDGAKFAKAATGLITGLLDTIIETIDKTDWAGVWRDIIDFLVNVNWVELTGKLVIAAGKLILGITTGLIQAIAETDWGAVWDSILKAFKDFFGIHSPSTVMQKQGSYIVSGLLSGLKNNIGSVINWLGNIPKWFKEKFDIAYKNVKNAFSGARTYFSGVWSGIKEAFGNISDWFRNSFSSAWQAVKDVFSSGGEVFNGIKDGVLDSLKSIINALIDGINSVISIPFNGLNSALDMIRNVEIIGYYPFGWLPSVDVPQIPHLAQGTVVPPNREFMAVLGDNKREPEVVSPISTIEEASKRGFMSALTELGLTGGGNSGTIIIKQYLDGKQVTQAVIKEGKLQQMSTGNNIFALG